MSRTLRASLASGLIGLVAVGGIGWFLGFGSTTALAAGAVAGAAGAGLVLAAAWRAGTFDGEHAVERGGDLDDHRRPAPPTTD